MRITTLRQWRNLAGGITLSALLMVSVAGSVSALSDRTPPQNSFKSGAEGKAPFEPGTRDAQATQPLGAADLTQSSAAAVTPMAGIVANVDFMAPLQYCSNNLLYTPVKNATTVSKSLYIRVYNQGMWRDLYTTAAANTTVYPAFYGVSGSYTAYLYVWNGSTYQYDELRSGTHTCSVSVTRVSNASGWVELKIQNTGTAYVTQQSAELAPFPAAGTYTGTHYDYPAVGGAALYRWFWVGTSPYGIVSHTLGSNKSPIYFTGDL